MAEEKKQVATPVAPELKDVHVDLKKVLINSVYIGTFGEKNTRYATVKYVDKYEKSHKIGLPLDILEKKFVEFTNMSIDNEEQLIDYRQGKKILITTDIKLVI